MAIIKCKMCGGDIDLSADKTFGVCEYCGSTMTFPKIDDEHRAAAFNRGNHFRRIGEFDKALAIYENIVRENDDDAEAHWCCALCRFGIEYVEDPASHEWLPTCHRASFDSILEDVDYRAALEHSDGVTRRQYEKDAAKIAEVQRGILATSQKEEPFDVFICYKETDDSGQRTRDSMLAQDVYYQLTEKGYRVFFARITLEDKAGSEYEPYIFAALNSAKVMICIGTKPEHFNAVWVKNEWSRFLALMRKDRKKLLLPCYRDMDPYDLPEQLSVLQSYDMSKIGFIQDLIRGVSKVVDAEKVQNKPAQTVVVNQGGGSANLDALLKRGNMSLEDGDWASADKYFDRVLDANAECAEAYLGKFLAVKQCATLEKYGEKLLARTEQAESRKLEAVPEDSARIEEGKKNWNRPQWQDHAGLYSFDRSYASTLASRQTQRQQTLAEYDGERLLLRAAQFADEKLKAKLASTRKMLADGLDERITRAKAEDERSIAQVKFAYAKHLDEAEAELELRIMAAEDREARQRREEERKRKEAERVREEAERKREEDYQSACQAQSAAKTEREFREAGALFFRLNGYEDSAAREKACKERAEALEAEAIAAKKRKKLCILLTMAAAVIVVVAVALTMKLYIIPSGHYKDAEALLAAGDYDGAVEAFTAAGSYSDAAERINEPYYVKAEALLAAGDYDGAVEAFTAAGSYSDAAERVNEPYYVKAEALLEDGETTRAAMAFSSIGNYKDAKERGRALWDLAAERRTIAAGGFLTVALKSDGTVVGHGPLLSGVNDTRAWRNIVAIAAGYDDRTVGLKSDGTVVAVGDNDYGQCNTGEWTDIVAIAAGWNHTVGLKSDGTVVAVGRNSSGQRNTGVWTNIVAIAAGLSHTVGLKSDGTVVAVGHGFNGQCDTGAWTDIVAIAAGWDHTVGLKSDGTVVAVGGNDDGQCDTGAWTDIVAIAAGCNHTVGLKSDGTVVAVGSNDYFEEYCGQCNVSDWTGIVSVAAGSFHTVGLKSDGTVVAVGHNNYGQCDVSDWTDIKLP